MKPHRQKRLGIILFITAGLAIAAGLTLFALRQNINMFFTPTQVVRGEVTSGVNFRIGGMVKEGSLMQAGDSLQVQFVTTDFVNEVPVSYTGILPDLFREGQGIVAEGQIDISGIFQASRVLAKHDENYMSPEVKAALDAAGASSENYSMALESES
ncbi:MAG: cytochrome c maturation protein CcmE [Gammaproteobacteria bacterium]|nr:cytochrome c maturation protein CcmE [Gammaproteobacteria bacterium]MCY4358271.1 cytochrome c maturation protein CcmE [Gammaproteobacteria bacterium]